MRRVNFNLILLIFLLSTVFLNFVSSQYWFQSGVTSFSDSAYNKGAGVTIQTIVQNVTNGSFGFWVGESLSNGAFIQVGYEIENLSGYYHSYCNPNGCEGTTLITAGKPTWFWEYFPASYSGDSFYGGIGNDSAVGSNNTFNMYSFRANGTVWNFYFNNQRIGSVDLGTSDSGPNSPSVISEYAFANNNKTYMHPIIFKNLNFYDGRYFKLVSSAQSYVGYGRNSQTQLSNPYGVAEVGSYVNYFMAGSDLPNQNHVPLWSLGYTLNVQSKYGNVSGSGNYTAYTKVALQAPKTINISKNVREVFAGWGGSGAGSYTGTSTSIVVSMNSNITETVIWKTQYYLNATTTYGNLIGGGWYDENSTALLNLSSVLINFSLGRRVVFDSWSNGAKDSFIMLRMNAPKIINAKWKTQYMVNATSPYGTVSGNGWYDENSTVLLYLNKIIEPISENSRLTFVSWSNGYTNSSLQIRINSPVFINAEFKPEHLVRLLPQNAGGSALENVSYYNINGEMKSDVIFLFGNRSYTIESIYYKDTLINTNYTFNVAAPFTVIFQAPVYDVVIRAKSIFGSPVNASVKITFKNGSGINTFLGKNGTLIFYNVPYGYAVGDMEYFGSKQSINLSNGISANFIFFTPSFIATMIVAIIIIIIIGKIESKRLVGVRNEAG